VRRSDVELEASSVVANSAMNRERQLSGVNSYARELGFDPAAWLAEHAATSWLDLCCGTGRALIAAGVKLPEVTITGVDLVDAFDQPTPPNVRLLCASLHSWAPSQPYDLITCVHGLHYIGDKLGLLSRAAGWLTAGGRFVADLDLSSVRVEGVTNRQLTASIRRAGFTYDARRHRISRIGPARITLPYAYLGADDHAGPNYTGQPAVDSHYQRMSTRDQQVLASEQGLG
jgi:SAM-dependent methyltransferase